MKKGNHDPQVIAYLQNKMTAAEKEAFELRLLDYPELLEDIMLEQTLLQNAEHIDFSGVAELNNSKKDLPLNRPMLSNWWSGLLGMGFGALCTALLMVTAYLPSEQSIATTDNIVFVEALRSAAQDPITLDLDSNGNVGFFIQTPSLIAQTYMLTISAEQDQSVLIQQQLETNAAGETLAIIHLSELSETALVLNLTNLDSLETQGFKILVNR